MDPKTRYELERSRNKKQRIDAILEAAERVFAQKGLEKTTMQDIARQANLGVATVFRFFPKKDLLILAVSAKRLEALLEVFRSVDSSPLSCIEKLERLFDHFVQLLKPDQLDHVKVMENFDNYAAHLTGPVEGMEHFSSVWKEISKTFQSIIHQGVRDGSIRSDIDVHDTLITAMNAFATFARKLSLQKNILLFEQDLEPDQQLLRLKEMLLSYLKA